MQTILKNILDKSFELEGLVSLALNRSEIPEELKNLILSKGEELAGEFKSLKGIESEVKPAEVSAEKPELEIDPLAEYSLEEDFEDNPQSESENEIDKDKNPESRGKLVFSINDRFRFRNLLFSDSDVDFNNTLAFVASMENYEEAEDYFLNEQNWNPKQEGVDEFLAILKRYFK